MTTYSRPTRHIAFDILTHKYEDVPAELLHLVPAAKVITLHWSETCERWITIPQD
jgi:hypothetical protein